MLIALFGFLLVPSKSSQKACTSVGQPVQLSLTKFPPASPLASFLSTRVAQCSGWCTSPTRCNNQTKSYDFRSSPAPDARTLLKRAIRSCALGVGTAGSVVPSFANGWSTKCQYLCLNLSSYPVLRAGSGLPSGRSPLSLPSAV